MTVSAGIAAGPIILVVVDSMQQAQERLDGRLGVQLAQRAPGVHGRPDLQAVRVGPV